MAETTVFQSGNSQAVRLPKEFRFKSKTVEIFRRGDEVVLREKKRTLGEVLAEAWAELPPLTDDDVRSLDRAMQAAKETRPPEERDWYRSDDAAAPATRRSPRRRKAAQ